MSNSSKTNVSSSFSSFLAKNSTAVEEARKAENSMQTCKMPVGWEGHAVCTGAIADKGKDRKKEDGSTQPGNPYVRLDFSVINDEKYAGATFSIAWSFYDSDKASSMDRFEWCMNAMENMGLPEEVRRADDFDIADALKHFSDGDAVFSAKVEHNSYRRGDQKEVKVALVDTVDDSDSVMPTEGGSKTYEIGGTAKYMGKEWEVVEIDGDDITLKSKTTGNTKNLKVDNLD